MSNIATLPSRSAFTDAQLRLIRQTVAADTNPAEFDLFIAAAQHAGLDPFRKQISAIVFSKNNAAKRKMSIITTIDGFRVIAERTRRYRPDDMPPAFVMDEAQRGPENPAGIVSVSVKVYKRDDDGQWFPCIGEAYWSEFAPIEDEWVNGEDGNRRRSGKKSVSGNWARMPRVMLAKCAEAQALRRAFPDAFSGLYAEDEMERARVIDQTPSEALEAYEVAQRQAMLGGPSILFVPAPGEPMEAVAVGKVADWITAQSREWRDPRQVESFRTVNREALRQFWAHSNGDALEVKKMLDAKHQALSAA